MKTEDRDSNLNSNHKAAMRREGKRRWWLPRFRLMDLIWIAVLAAVLMRWHIDRQSLLMANARIASLSRSAGSMGSIYQVLGEPNTLVAGRINQAWASATPNGSREWIIAEFPRAIEVQKIVVYETYNPGAIDRITAVGFTGRETEIWKGTDPTPKDAAMGESSFPIKSSISTRRVKIYIDSKGVTGSNQIDAIALHGTNGSVQWASQAWASSASGDNVELPRWFSP